MVTPEIGPCISQLENELFKDKRIEGKNRKSKELTCFVELEEPVLRLC